MITLGASTLGTLDWTVIGGYLALLVLSGIWFARREPSGADEYFLAGRRMPAWAVSFSIIATTLSVATFVGAPDSSFRGNLSYLTTNIGSIIAVLVVAAFFIPVYYRYNVTTVYELLERRYGVGAKRAASATFMVGRLFASGARVYIASIPLAMVLFGEAEAKQPAYLIGAIGVLTLAAVLYTLIGGIASVIWTDVLQTLVLIGAVVAGAAVLLHKIPLSIPEIYHALESTKGMDGSCKLDLLKIGINAHEPMMGFEPDRNYTVLTALLGFSLLNMAAYGTDHDLAQRMLTCKSALKGSRSAIGGIFLNLPIVALFMIVGLLLFVFYRRPDMMAGRPAPEYPVASDGVFLTFILHELPAGLTGLMVAGLFAAGLGSLNSAINAMGATTIKDFYVQARPGRDERHYLVAGRWAVAGWGVAMALFASFCIFWKRSSGDTLIDFALNVMTFAYSGLLAVFATAIFTKRGSTRSAIAALIVGFVVIGLFQPAVWHAWTGWFEATRASARSEIERWALGDLKLAYPWHMLIATVAAFAVCCAGKPRDDQVPGSAPVTAH
jgi:solute:Na+ symporter, SSS family